MQDFAKQVILKLAEGQVEFVVVGGVSAVLQGVAYTTLDLDICYKRSPENCKRLASVLAPLQPRMRGLAPDLPFTLDERALQLGCLFNLEIADESLDLLGEVSGLGAYENILAGAEEVPIGSWSVKILSLTQLITAKKAAGRAKDLAVLPHLELTLQLRQEAESSDDPSP